MYKLFVFLIVLILFIFEISLYIFFDKSLDANVLILMGIMILPGLFTLLKRDAIEYQNIKR